MYKIHYPKVPNMGDLLNKDMLEELFNIRVVWSPVYLSNMSAIGSGLGARLIADNPKVRAKQVLTKPFRERTHHIWGTGFISYSNHKDASFIFKDIKVHSLRGKLSLERMEKILGKRLDIPLGDGGLLADKWVGPVSKKFKVGIIPHFREIEHPIIKELKEYYDNSIIIDLGGEPKKVVKHIAECETIISSSLHGLIIADSYHIPNIHMMLYPFGDKVKGDGFKFKDYYSVYDLNDDPVIITERNWPKQEEINQNYKIGVEQVEKIKKDIFNAFPRL